MLLFCFLVVSLLQIQQLNAVALRKIRAGDSIVLRSFYVGGGGYNHKLDTNWYLSVNCRYGSLFKY